MHGSWCAELKGTLCLHQENLALIFLSSVEGLRVRLASLPGIKDQFILRPMGVNFLITGYYRQWLRSWHPLVSVWISLWFNTGMLGRSPDICPQSSSCICPQQSCICPQQSCNASDFKQTLIGHSRNGSLIRSIAAGLFWGSTSTHLAMHSTAFLVQLVAGSVPNLSIPMILSTSFFVTLVNFGWAGLLDCLVSPS